MKTYSFLGTATVLLFLMNLSFSVPYSGDEGAGCREEGVTSDKYTEDVKLEEADVAYCYPTSTSPYNFYIKEVVIGSISNTEDQEDKKTTDSGSNGYISTGIRDYSTQFSTPLSIGAAVTITGKVKSYSSSHVYGWIDYNKNEIFEASELVFDTAPTTNASTANFSATFTVDSDASSGATKLRVLLSKNTISYPICSQSFEGEMEDYEVVLEGGGDTTLPTVVLSTAVLGIDATFDVVVNFNEDVIGLDASDFILTNNATGIVQPGGSDPSFYVLTIDVANSSSGEISITLPANSAADAAGNGNEVSNTLTVIYNPSELVITGNITAESQDDAHDGAIDISVTGGTGNYVYSWSNGAVTEDLSGVTGGTYTVTVVDGSLTGTYTATVSTNSGGGGGCDQLLTTSLPEQSTTEGSQVAANAIDGNPETSAKTSWQSGPEKAWWQVSLGTEDRKVSALKLFNGSGSSNFNDFDILISSDPFPVGMATNGFVQSVTTTVGLETTIDLPEPYPTGKYIRFQKNKDGKLKIGEVEVKGCSVSTELKLTLKPTNPTAPNSNDGSVEAIVTGGTAPYKYFWSIPNQGISTTKIENLGTGKYCIEIIDALGNKLNDCAELEFNVDPIVIDLVATNASSNVAADGSINTTVSGGWGPYTYEWSNGMSIEDPIELESGLYGVLVTDALGEIEYAKVTVGFGPNDISISGNITNATADGSPTGAIDVTVTGGSPGYSFYWSNYVITEDLVNIPNNTYSVTVTDQNGNTRDAKFKVEISGGGGNCLSPIELSLNKPSFAKTEVSGNAADVVDGDLVSYLKTEYHSANEPAWWEINLEGIYQLESISLTPKAGSNRLSEFEILVSDQQFTSEKATSEVIYTYTGIVSSTEIINFDLPIPEGSWLRIQNFTDGKLEIAEVKINGCVPTVSAALGLTYTVNPPTGVNESDGAIILNTYGGVEPLVFDWGSQGNNMNLSMIPAGTYSVTVTDATSNSVEEIIIVDAVDVIPVGTYHELNKKLDGSVAYSAYDNLRFKYHEKYDPNNNDKLSYKLYGDSGPIPDNGVKLINAASDISEHKYGMNFYRLPIDELNLSWNKVYTLEVNDGNKGESYYLRFLRYCPLPPCADQ